jgi:hypothetical protein
VPIKVKEKMGKVIRQDDDDVGRGWLCDLGSVRSILRFKRRGVDRGIARMRFGDCLPAICISVCIHMYITELDERVGCGLTSKSHS